MTKKKRENPPGLQIPQPLQVEIYKEEKTGEPSKRIPKFAAVGVILLFLSSLSFVFWLRHTVPFSFENSALPVTIYIDKPYAANLRDAFLVTVLLRNTSAETLNGILNVRVQPASALSLEENGLTSLKVENLAPGASLTRNLKFVPLEAPPDGSLRLVASLTDDQGRVVMTEADQAAVRVLGIPRLQSALAWIFGSGGLLATLTGLFWERVKKALSV